MKQPALLSVLAATAFAFAAGAALAQSAGSVQSLRGADVTDAVPVEPVFHQEEQRFERAYRQQPPLIPHTIEKYQIDVKANECLACHEWSNSAGRGAPTLSMTHYVDRDGLQSETVSARRWFCNQCHVPQVNAPELVENTFKPFGQ
ncbi:nitrate reductase cytochrome c-type subunit [Pseudothioclava nitratireducens]|jgi:cytochrome c-type protein NapB|uniref:nitrate reductase cytochrome c-type subunit n=1 Tax=Pseudothioclava nitratireducens TaxID=1928646 RepID=UPI0023DC557A|nr:nitrate reductase cytochrome c-type subunit [Defluviimonas nitratireducens]MDF1618895.1 nitrate reductase cytochrome c-type subunit [Defluviimonas nitratireducens]